MAEESEPNEPVVPHKPARVHKSTPTPAARAAQGPQRAPQLEELHAQRDAGSRQGKIIGRYYTVRKGDTLQEISMKFYGTTKNWRRIYNANKGTVKDPNKLTEGMKINIP